MPPFFFLGSGGGAWMFLFPSFHLLPCLQSKPSPLASLVDVPPSLGLWKGSSQGNHCWPQRHSLHHQLCLRLLAEVFGDLSLCFAKPESWDCLIISRAPGTFGSLQAWVPVGGRGLERRWINLFRALKGHILQWEKNFWHLPLFSSGSGSGDELLEAVGV